MDNQEDYRINYGLPEQPVLKKPDKIIESNILHIGYNIPFMECQHNRENYRKCYKQD